MDRINKLVRIFGRKDNANDHQFGNKHSSDNSPFNRYFNEVKRYQEISYYHSISRACDDVLKTYNPEEMGELLIDLSLETSFYDGYKSPQTPHEQVVYYTFNSYNWYDNIEVREDHLEPLITILLNKKEFRRKYASNRKIFGILKLIDSAIKQGGYLTSSICEKLIELAFEIREIDHYSKVEAKKLLKIAERIEKLAGAEMSTTEFLLQRCEGAKNPLALTDPNPKNAEFWAALLAEVTDALIEIQESTKSKNNPKWLRDQTIFEETWPAVDEVTPIFGAWNEEEKLFGDLKKYNDQRSGFSSSKYFHNLAATIPKAYEHSQYLWDTRQIPALDILADLENTDWTALVEHLITKRRSTKATAKWKKEALDLCEPLGIENVQERLHKWLTLYHTPVLDKRVYTEILNGEKFALTIIELEQKHPEWPSKYPDKITSLGRAVAMVVASKKFHRLSKAFHTGLIKLNDHVYKNKCNTDGKLSLYYQYYKKKNGGTSYRDIGSWLQVSIENEEFLRGAVWLLTVLPDRRRSIEALEKIAQTSAANIGGSRSKIIANAAIATLIAMGDNDIDNAVLSLSKTIEDRAIIAPLYKYLNK